MKSVFKSWLHLVDEETDLVRVHLHNATEFRHLPAPDVAFMADLVAVPQLVKNTWGEYCSDTIPGFS